MKFKTVVPKQGDINSYINKPVTDKINITNYNMDSTVIGVISDAKEVELGYELTVELFNNAQFEWEGNNLISFSMGTK